MMRTLGFVACLGCMSIGFAACGDDDITPGSDAGSAMDGGGGALDASGGGDAGSARDARVPDRDAGTGIGSPLCDPRDPDACPEGERCGFIATSTSAQFTCRLGGSAMEGETCAFSASGSRFGDNCLGGTLCARSLLSDDLTCVRPCVQNSDCRAGELCNLIAASLAPLAPAGRCEVPGTCDPIAQTGCGPGETCGVYSDTTGAWHSDCVLDGDRGEGELCVRCAHGMECLPAPLATGGFDFDRPLQPHEPFRCQELCDPAAPTSTCSTRSSGCVAIDPSGSTAAGVCRIADPDPVGGPDRPARVVVPESYDGTTPIPLLLTLHGLGGDASSLDGGFRFYREAQRQGFFLVAPDGTIDSMGRRFWNATSVCCDTDGSGVDDSTYLAGLITEMQLRYRVNAARIYVMGYSNGAFMANRMACDHADLVTAIVNGAGSTFNDETDCHASRPVSVLGIHGSLDPITGGVAPGLGTFPNATTTIERWATRAGCDITMPTDDATPFDMDLAVDGPDTTARRYMTGCMTGVDAEQWTIAGGTHAIEPSDEYTSRFAAWLLRHSR